MNDGSGVTSREWMARIFGAAVFVVVFYFGYRSIDGIFFMYRDDGLITLSHARNFIEYGFIGVNPSGERVEGYSAPLQFLLFALMRKVFGVGFEFYFNAQTYVLTAIMGGLFMALFPGRGKMRFILTSLAAVCLMALVPFFEWHGSGMENPITHTLFLLSVLILAELARRETVSLWWSVFLFLAAISRLDGVYHVAIMLSIFCLYWFVVYRDLRAFKFALAVLVQWSLFQVCRYAYFGEFLPNTALAQGISVGQNLANLFAWDRSYLDRSLRAAATIFSAHGGYILLCFMPLMVLLRRDRPTVLLLLLTGGIVLTSALNPFLFGETRLDVTRSTTQMAVAVVMALAVVIAGVMENHRRLAWLLIPAVIAGGFAYRANAIAPYYLCCSITKFDGRRLELTAIAEREGLPRPTVAIPDLGLVSWHKQFNIVDLGLLGSRFVAGLPNNEVLSTYFFDFAAPDMIESHGVWSCLYDATIFRDPRFRERYQPVREVAFQRPHLCDGRSLLDGIWVRRNSLRASGSVERQLIDRMMAEPSAALLADELKRCGGGGGCLYVTRTAYRFLPELLARHSPEDLKRLFAGSETRDYDVYLMEGGRQRGDFAAAAAVVRNRGPRS